MTMDNKKLILSLGFTPKENTVGIFQKIYSNANNYAIEIDFEKEIINFGNKIKGESKTTQNFSQAENWVVLECVNRLLEKGYQPHNITLEKTWKTGHGTSGRLDILISKEDNSAYLMIECKTWGTEFEKELKNLEKNGGQLFTYFQQDKNADVLVLYASKLDGKKVEYKNTIVKIEEDYRQAGNVKDFFERWNKLPKTNGVFDTWVAPYEFQSKALTKNDLKVLRQEDSSFIFNRFLEILRHNVVSDKPNAFNKIFTLFLCKIVDENRNPDDQLHFQWLEGEDDHISFQKRLTDLYNRGMLELLEKKVTDVSDSEFDKQFLQVETQYKEKFKEILTEIRLKKNNEFAIKEVYDDASFEENAKVVKEVVELLQVYQIRYNYRQQFLSDFFELLLTTGLKQESGQFFTPVPIARFIIKSLPFQEITAQKIEQGNKNDLLPTIIDYAAGSGHFITESMEVVQNYIDSLNESSFNPTTKRAIEKWKVDQFDWAESYVYGIEKDYRLVKTAKVSCYLHGDGLAKVIHGDGLGDFATSTEFKDLLKETDKTYPQDNKQFDVIISNPPYSVSAFKGLMDEEKSRPAFDLYSRLTDQSSEIECLFIERTKQLLKDGGVAGIILPDTILNNTGIYTQTREILLKHFEILGIAELGSNTFMATKIKTITLFLRRRNNADAYNIEEAIKKCFVSLQDVTINGIEKPLEKYLSHVWESISFDDYKTLLQKSPNKNIEEHEIYKEYTKKIKAKNTQEFLNSILALEQDKLLYFIIAYPQKLVLVKTGEKNEEKLFLGYEFSDRRGSEGIHALQRTKSIDECTQLYDADSFTNPEKASFYIYKAFLAEYDLEIPKVLQKNVRYQNLVDIIDFEDIDSNKKIFLSEKRKVNFEEIWGTSKLTPLQSIADVQKGKSITKAKTAQGDIPVIAGGQNPAYFHNQSNREGNVITVSASGAYAGFVNYFDMPIFASDCNTIQSKNEANFSTKLIFHILKSIQKDIYELQRGQAQPHVYGDDLEKIKIPTFGKDKQQIILDEISKIQLKAKSIVIKDIELEIKKIILKHLL
jgi:type I restriction enzyme M protein